MRVVGESWCLRARGRLGVVAVLGLLLATASACGGSSSRQEAPRRVDVTAAGTGGGGGTGSGVGEPGSAGGDDAEPCRPRPCTAPVCGVMQEDGCGKLVECSCTGCVPASCASQGAECGSLDDGCGRKLDCGQCEGEETCGGSGTPNLCGCAPTSCELEGWQCGEHSDGCGGMLDCGACKGGCPCDDRGQCQVRDAEEVSVRGFGHAAASSGFLGTDAQYAELSDVPCFSEDDCVEPCLSRDGTQAMCEASTCDGSSAKECVPATVWTGLERLSSEGSDPALDSAQLFVWSGSYRDVLRVTDFHLAVPDAAEITGITVTVRHASDSSDEVVDAAVQLVKGGAVSNADRSSALTWPSSALASVDYGGPSDRWNETWTPADVNAADFGVALSATFTRASGNARAYVDIVYVTVNYQVTCE